MRIFRTLVLVLVLCTCSVQSTKAQNFGLYLESKKGIAEIPFKHLNNLIIFQITINDSDSLSFILDTGVKNTILLENELADSLNLEHGRSINIRGTGNYKDINAYIVPQIKVSSGNLKGDIYSLIVIEEDSLNLEELFGRKIHGIIGYDVFSRFIVKLDYERSKIFLYEKASFKLRRSYKTIPIELINSKPYIETSITNNGVITSGKFMLDIGASHACLIELSEYNNFKIPDNYISCNLGRGLAGPFYGYKSRVDKLTINQFNLKQPIISYTESYSPLDTSNTEIRHGTLGAEIFGRFNIIFDYNGNSIYLKKNGHFREKFEHNLSGIELIVKGNQLNVFVINEIRKGSAAYNTGLKKGDFIYSINGTPTRTMNIDEINNIFHSRSGRKIRLWVLRNGELVKYSFKLKRDI